MSEVIAVIKPKRPCRAPGCNALTSETYCAAHKRQREKKTTPKSWHRLYGDPASGWQRLRGEQLLREPWCRSCAASGLRVRATEVDHIRPHRGDRALFSDPDNLQSLCHRCHSRKTMAENAEVFRRPGGRE